MGFGSDGVMASTTKSPSTGVNTAVRLSAADLAIIRAAQERLGLRTISDVLRMGLRSLALEYDLPTK